MHTPSSIRLLASTNNVRGDLFTRLMKDLFFALGYDELRLDVHKSGREIDLQGRHRLEPRCMAAECKAHADKIGGDDLNKFFGVLARERDRHQPTPVTGYFVSLSGFRETGREQELVTSEQKRVILIDGRQVIEDLQSCRALVAHAVAVEQAGHCAEYSGLKEGVLDGAELLGHELGYLWAVYYSHGKARTHFALIHADGTPLAEPVAQEVIAADRDCGGALHHLNYLAPPLSAPDRAARGEAAIQRYCQWISEECGYIQLDGLPTDTDLSAARLRLERLFVPLKVVAKVEEPGDEEGKAKEVTHSVGGFLHSQQHVAILAAPGGGKSTLLKRVAIAYAAPERRTEIDDDLPRCDWLPLFLRCRELKERAHRPILELLADIPPHAGMNSDEGAAFMERLHEALRLGRALLLIDGLDEISDEGARQTFAQHLRTFVAMFPQAALLVTSREAGFRHVAGVIAGACVQTRLAPFDQEDVRRLCEHWHVEVVGDTAQVRSDALALADTIWQSEGIRPLAENPLMLTTLLVVRRCIGDLPNRRVELYREAVRVLIRTWNTEGFAPMDLDETCAQLSYVACTMMTQGIQQIGHKALLKLLREARRELAAELEFSRIGPTEFIERIEYRSSLLMQTGHERLDGELQPVYEFRHLTFQEYLAARGFVEEQYPGREAAHDLADLLAPHFKDERWREVVPLAAVLAGRKADETVKRLTRVCGKRQLDGPRSARHDANPHVALLTQCLLDEVQVTPATLRAALLELARQGDRSDCQGLLRGKFGEVFRQLADEAYFGPGEGWDEYRDAQVSMALHHYLPEKRINHPAMAKIKASPALLITLTEDLALGERQEKTRAALTTMISAFSLSPQSSTATPVEDPRFQPIYELLVPLVDPNDPPLALAATWALAWIGEHGLWRPQPSAEWLLQLFRIWREAISVQLAYVAAWALSVQSLLPRDTFGPEDWGNCETFLRKASCEDSPARKQGQSAAFIVGWYRRAPWDDRELAAKIDQEADPRIRPSFTFRELLATLGDPGQEVLAKWDKKQEGTKGTRGTKQNKGTSRKRR